MAIKCYTVKEIADLLGVHANTVRSEITKGTLQAKKVGVEWRISEKQYNDYINADVHYDLDTIRELEDEVENLRFYKEFVDGVFGDIQKALIQYRERSRTY